MTKEANIFDALDRWYRLSSLGSRAARKTPGGLRADFEKPQRLHFSFSKSARSPLGVSRACYSGWE